MRAVESPERHAGKEVVAHLVQHDAASAAAGVETLNAHDVVLVQHEYGIYGGLDGADVVAVVEALTVPTIVVLHTVLEDPRPNQRWGLERLVEEADLVVTMTEAGRQRLVHGYGVDPTKAHVVPHGAAGPPQVRRGHRAAARPVILTGGAAGAGQRRGVGYRGTRLAA